MTPERRRHPRKSVNLTVHYKLGGGGFESQPDLATDLSKGGLFIRTQRAPRKGETFQVELAWDPGGPAVNATCRVIRISKEGVGVEFLGMDPDSALLLNHLLAS